MTAVDIVKTAVIRAAGAFARWTGVFALSYRKIGDSRHSNFDRRGWSATADEFDQQLRWLKSHFDIISPREIPYVVRVRRGRHVVITFDAGHLGTFTDAFPRLRAHNVPATIFVCTGFIDHPRLPWQDEVAWMVNTCSKSAFTLSEYIRSPLAVTPETREQSIRLLVDTCLRLPESRGQQFLNDLAAATGSGRFAGNCSEYWMNWDMIREMKAGGMTIGGHGLNLKALSALPRDVQRQEICECARRIMDELGLPMRVFSYPTGRANSFNDETRGCLRDAGVHAAFSAYGGFRQLREWDAYDIPRLPVVRGASFDTFRASVLAPQWRRADI